MEINIFIISYSWIMLFGLNIKIGRICTIGYILKEYFVTAINLS